MQKYMNAMGESKERFHEILEIVEQKMDFRYMMSSEIGPWVCEFLEPSEIVGLRLVNKFAAAAIKNKIVYSNLLAKKIMVKHKTTQRELLEKLSNNERVSCYS